MVDLANMEEDDPSLEKRVSRIRIAIRFAKLIAKYGKKAWNFIFCVGTSPFWRCGDDVSLFEFFAENVFGLLILFSSWTVPLVVALHGLVLRVGFASVRPSTSTASRT